jgi:glucose-6-phosphate-specific signal transduction histidine kinase
MEQGIDPDSVGRKSRFGPAGLDLAWVLAITSSVAWLAIRFELNEKIFESTRHLEYLQLDEAPIVLFALVSCLTWFAWRRYRDARAELAARRAAEAKLENVLYANRRLAQQYVQVQELERKSLARELHDELGQYLNAIKTDAVSIHERAGGAAAQFSRASLAIVQHADHVHGVVRDLIRKLRPVALDDLGLRAALEHFFDQWRQRFPRITVNIAFDGELDDLDEQISLTLFRLVQESMTNIAKHADASLVKIELARQADAIAFSIADNGIGGDGNARSAGLGLIGMRERVEMLGGTLRVTTAPAHGFSIHARVPVIPEQIEVAS